MITLLNQIIWWTGAGVLSAGAALGVAALIAGMAWVAVQLAAWGMVRFFNVGWNLHAVHEWVRAGRPKWEFGADRVARLVPTERRGPRFDGR